MSQNHSWEILVIQWLGLHSFFHCRVQFLIEELRSHKLQGDAKKKKERETKPFLVLSGEPLTHLLTGSLSKTHKGGEK